MSVNDMRVFSKRMRALNANGPLSPLAKATARIVYDTIAEAARARPCACYVCARDFNPSHVWRYV